MLRPRVLCVGPCRPGPRRSLLLWHRGARACVPNSIVNVSVVDQCDFWHFLALVACLWARPGPEPVDDGGAQAAECREVTKSVDHRKGKKSCHSQQGAGSARSHVGVLSSAGGPRRTARAPSRAASFSVNKPPPRQLAKGSEVGSGPSRRALQSQRRRLAAVHPRESRARSRNGGVGQTHAPQKRV